MKIAILGTRGIPNNYGGFEQFAEFISIGLVNRGHEVTVYNPHFHTYALPDFQGVKIITIKSPEKRIGSVGNFIYDYNCLKDAIKRDFDIIYEAGYGTCSPFFYLLNKSRSSLIINMDGLEWKRSKWGFITRRLMKYLEYLAIQNSHYLISDNQGIQQYYRTRYQKDSFLIPYGADVSTNHCKEYLEGAAINEHDYFMLIARMEPENNIDLILSAYTKSQRKEAFIVIGDYRNKYGSFLYKKYNSTQIRFLGSIYDKKILDGLRFYCKAYLHGHSVGGTNPSLLEAMASQSFIIAHKNRFNASVLKSNALYFETIEDLKNIYLNIEQTLASCKNAFVYNNTDEIKNKYSWDLIIRQHEEVFNKIILKNKIEYNVC